MEREPHPIDVVRVERGQDGLDERITHERPRQESNLCTPLRRRMLYPTELRGQGDGETWRETTVAITMAKGSGGLDRPRLPIRPLRRTARHGSTDEVSRPTLDVGARIARMSFDPETSLRLIGELLGAAHIVGNVPKITVRSVRILEQSLAVDVLATSDDRNLLLGQAASVMGGLSGLDVSGMFPSLSFTTFAVRLVDGGDNEILWVVSSPDDARFAEGSVIRWLRNSIVQDNTPAYRRSQADRLVSQLEVGLRDLLHVHWLDAHGAGYASVVLTAAHRQVLRRMARREGEDQSGDRTLLDYTMLPQLAEYAVGEPLLVAHGCVDDPSQLADDLARVNKVRRKVAHHREITADDLRTLRDGAGRILQAIGSYHPELVIDFVVQRWDDALRALTQQLSADMKTDEPPTAGSMPESERQAIAAATLRQQAEAATRALSALGTLVVPPVRRTAHEVAEHALHDLAAALRDLAELANQPRLDLEAIHDGCRRHADAMAQIRQLGDELERVLVLEDATS